MANLGRISALKAAASVALIVLAAIASHAASPESLDDWDIPNMQTALREAWQDNDGITIASTDASAGVCGQPKVKAAGCPVLLDPEFGWWTGNADRRNAFLMAVLVRDNYPINHNLGADGDETPEKRSLWQCLLRQKWAALGAEKVEFYESKLNNVVVIKVGNNIFANMRGTWTDAHRDSNMEWRLGQRRKLWGTSVRYHTGWGKTAEDSWGAIKKIVKGFNVTKSECKLWLSGHSRGGGAALLTAAFADGGDAPSSPCKVSGVWTFGSVKPYDSAFNKVYNQKLGHKTWNWWNQIDVVPTLPPAIAGYGTQIPRLRIGLNETCPGGVTTTTCLKDSKNRSICPRRKNGAMNHHDYEYSAHLAECSALTLGLTEGCVDALAPPYSPPSEREQRRRKKEQQQQEQREKKQQQREKRQELKGTKEQKGAKEQQDRE